MLAAWLLLAPAVGALDAPTADLGPRLLEARRAWERGDALGAQASQVALRGGDPIPLLDQQEAAYEAAEGAYREALKVDKTYPPALADYGRLLAARKRFREARLRLDAALVSPAPAFEPTERAGVLRALGGVLERAGQTRRAIECYRQALALHERDARTRISLAVALCAWEDAAPARELLEGWVETTATAKESPPPGLQALALYTLAYAQEQDGAPEAALESYRRARKAAERQLSVASGQLPGTNDVRPATGNWQLATAGETAGVAEQARCAALRVAALIRSLEAEGARPGYDRATVLCREGLRLKAAALGDRAAFAAAREKLWSASGPVEQGRLRQEEPLKSFYATIERFQQALQAYPKSARAHRELGMGYLALVELRTALPHLEAAAVYDPLSPGVLAALGEVRLATSDWEQALETFQKLLGIEPEYGPASLGLGRAALRLHRSEKDLDLARDALEHAFALGADARMVVRLQGELEELAAKVRRGEKLPTETTAAPRPPHPPRTAPEPVEPWRGSILDW